LTEQKKSGKKKVNLPIPEDLFKREVYVNVGISMLKRLQMEGQKLEMEEVKDRLLLTY
jgi:DNA adenine methylase